MAIKAGDTLPDVKLKELGDGGPKDVSLGELSKGKKLVLFAVPGAFTPTCSMKHLPGFVEKAADIKKKGVATIACLSVNDAFVMKAWGGLACGGDWHAGRRQRRAAKALGLELDASGFGMGKRSAIR
jgi:peroxiredoxin